MRTVSRTIAALAISLAFAACSPSTNGKSAPEPSTSAKPADEAGGETNPDPGATTPADQTQTGSDTVSDEQAAAVPGQGEPCADGSCADGLTCLRYYGIAGPRGPEFTSCEIPCKDDPSVCPEGQSCVVVADGPGSVCRPTPAK